MTRATFDLKLSDREILRMVLASQRDIADILSSICIGTGRANAALKAQSLQHNIDEVLKGIPSKSHG